MYRLTVGRRNVLLKVATYYTYFTLLYLLHVSVLCVTLSTVTGKYKTTLLVLFLRRDPEA